MINEKSAGVIVFRFHPNDGLQYLVLYMRGSYWNFPKGRVGDKETEIVAAKRELYEETGIKNIKMVEGWRQETEFFFKEDRNGRKELIKKRMVLFLAKTAPDAVVNLMHEPGGGDFLNGYAWLDYKAATKYLKFKNLKSIIKEADYFVNKRVEEYRRGQKHKKGGDTNGRRK
jgi:bis(5'-nucleosidyl)-tetraphosphatase